MGFCWNKKSDDEKTVEYIYWQVRHGVKLDDVLKKLEYIKKSEAIKLADRMQNMHGLMASIEHDFENVIKDKAVLNGKNNCKE